MLLADEQKISFDANCTFSRTDKRTAFAYSDAYQILINGGYVEIGFDKEGRSVLAREKVTFLVSNKDTCDNIVKACNESARSIFFVCNENGDDIATLNFSRICSRTLRNGLFEMKINFRYITDKSVKWEDAE